MPTIALRVPTVVPHQSAFAGGHAYILFPEAEITVGDLIAEKVRAEQRKARAGGPHVSSLRLLLPPEFRDNALHSLNEDLAIAQAERAFLKSAFWVVVDDCVQVALDARLTLSRETQIAFVVIAVPEVASA